MTDFTVTITDPAQLDGITWSRQQHNASIPRDNEGNPLEPLIEDDPAYVQFVMEGAAASYAYQKQEQDIRDEMTGGAHGN